MKRVTFVTDYTKEEWGHGGCETTIDELLKRAPDGIEARVSSFDSFEHRVQGDSASSLPLVSSIDLVIFGNIARFLRKHITATAEHVPYVKMEFDYGFCKDRLKNCSDGCKSCIEDGWYRGLLEGAELLFMVSPLQQYHYRQIVGPVADNAVLNPSWVEPDRWQNLGLERRQDLAMYHGRLFPHKGVLELAAIAMNNPEAEFLFVGSGPKDVEARIRNVRNCHLLGTLPHETLHALLNTVETWMMPSGWDDTGPMSAVEAYLCGAKVVHNGRLGYFSYPWKWGDPESVRDELRGIAGRFWSAIEEVLG